MDTSTFSDIQQTYPDAELLSFSGSTCDCYRVRLYGKLHFLKRLKPELRTDPRYVAALHKEFETGYRLDHPHLVRYMSCGDDHLLTEYVDGKTLKDFLVSYPDYFRSRKHADRFLSQLLAVVGYLHAHQVIHLDLKPENILITRIGHDVKLADLGFCYTDTYTDTMGRTDKYAAPEQLSGTPVDARTDIYAIGKILETLPCAHIYNKVIARCTAQDPSNRYQTVEELQETLKQDKSFLKFSIIMAVLLVGLVSLYYLVYSDDNRTKVSDVALSENHLDTTTAIKHVKDTIVLIQTQKPPLPSTQSNASVEHESEAEIPTLELSVTQKKEIRKTTLAIIRTVYDQRVVPIIDRVIHGDYDNNLSLISDSINRVMIDANQEVYARLREANLAIRYPKVSKEDIGQEELYAIGDVMVYYSKIIEHRRYPSIKIPPNPFDEQ